MPRENHSRNNVQIARSEIAMIDDSPAMGNLVKIKKAGFLSVVGSPSNQTGFKVVRSDPEGETPVSKPVIRRARRSDANPVLCLTFPADATEESVKQSLVSYGMDGYTIKQEDGLFKAMRSDLQSIANDKTMNIMLNEAGVVATVARADAPAEAKSGITMAAIEFDPAFFNEAQVGEWLKRNSIDSTIEQSENSGNALVVRRSAVPENEETRQMTLDAGVTAVIVRSDTSDIPEGYYSAVTEAAYGSYGWGHLDFAATIADTAFSDQIREGVNSLESVLRQILFYSALPIDTRKALMISALNQFGSYAGAIMDALPRQLLVSVVRSDPSTLEKSMTQNATESGKQAPAAVAPATTAPAAETPLTRADVATLVAEGITAAIARGDLLPKTDTQPATGTSPTPTGTEPKESTPQPISRSDIEQVLTSAMAPLVTRLEKMEGTTIARSDNPDATVAPVVKKTAEQIADEKKSGEVFRGALGSLVGRGGKK